MKRPSLELKALEETVINTPTLNEYKEILRVFDCGNWLKLGYYKYSQNTKKEHFSRAYNEYYRFIEMTDLEDMRLGIRKQRKDVCIQACNFYESDRDWDWVNIYGKSNCKKNGYKIITPQEFYKEENIPNSKIKEINDQFDKEEARIQFELEENNRLKSFLELKLNPLKETVINPKNEEEYRTLLGVFYFGNWMKGSWDHLPFEFYGDFSLCNGKTCEEADGKFIKGGSHVPFDTEWHRRLNHKIISPREFYMMQDINHNQIKKINDFLDKDDEYRFMRRLPNLSKLVKKNVDEIFYEIEEMKDSILKNPILKKKFYTTENGEEVDLSKLNPGWISDEEFKTGHKNFVFGCHDVMLEYDGGLLLVIRDNVPAKDVLWPIGGMYKKGTFSEKSLAKKVKEECNLDIDGEPIYLGDGRTAFQTDPWGHGHGTDTTNERYFAHAKGELKLNELHKNPVIVKPKDYTSEFRRGLEEYVRDFMDISMLFVEGMDHVLLYSYLEESLLKNP